MELVEVLKDHKGTMSYRSFAECLGINFITLHRFMRGNGQFTIDNIRALAETAKKNDDNQLIDAITKHVGL
ncbi:MAG: helix-turn-helix domain-containing protein [Planctomycetota bacterium]